MKKVLLAVALAGISSAAMANLNFNTNGLYVQGDVGYSKLEAKEDGDKLKDNSTSFSIAVGKDLGNTRYQLDYTNFGKIEKIEERNLTQGELNTVTQIVERRINTPLNPALLSAKGVNNVEGKIQSVGLSAIYDLQTVSGFTPYVGGRIGINQLKVSHDITGYASYNGQQSSKTQNIAKHKDTKVGAGVLAGVQYAVNPNLALDAGVQYNYLGKFDGIKANQYGAKVGVRYSF
ncbi:opacity family porin [Moraxella nasovis]|uniref:opacity family porin n=1 Tax=Moraxella nasovis TaxID=2904121 RepID=UPI001F608D36|nr:opacity family porin [Moraxella nasovis]UNU72595.1 opacity family porin [Moraxella nasovis]